MKSYMILPQSFEIRQKLISSAADVSDAMTLFQYFKIYLQFLGQSKTTNKYSLVKYQSK